ncbi:MAG: SpoIIE family protein phosphatase, partial [bacterium]|nr:SpoIIE family protein phosphatase [bacterium]
NLGKYLTIFYAIIDTETDIMSFSTGGQFPFPLYIDKNCKKVIDLKGPPVGLLKIANYKTDSIKLPQEFSIMFMSDGILEILKDKSLKEQEKELLDMFNLETSVYDLIKKIGIDTQNSLPDDITLLNVRRNKNE